MAPRRKSRNSRWTCPRSDAITTRASPDSNAYATDSLESWGVPSGRNPMSPIVPSRQDSIRTKGEKRFPSRPRAAAVPAVAKREQPNRAANVRAPTEWSPCSCVTKMARIEFASMPRVASRFSISFAESPASTRIRVLPDSTTQAFPPEPEARIETRTEED